jgi:tryptophan synthase alpha chain
VSAPGRIAEQFARLADEGRCGLVTFVTAGDPDRATSLAIVRGLAASGADVIELGIPFSDPMADGPAIQASSSRALAAGATMATTFAIARDFRAEDSRTPVVLMGYSNPVYAFGLDAFVAEARDAGVDGLIVVDLPPEEADPLAVAARTAGLDVIFLVAPTTGEDRMARVLENAGGFAYAVSITGITGTKRASTDAVARAVARVRKHTSLPVAVGFGIKTPAQAATIAGVADAAVVGSAIVERIAGHLDAHGRAGDDLVPAVLGFVGELATAVRAPARPPTGASARKWSASR